MIKFLAFLATVALAQDSHIAYLTSLEFLKSQQQKFLWAFIQEIDELTMSDVTIKQKTEYSRLTAQM
jgi:hypothetical protein